MESGEFVALIHLVGFVTAIALYGMLAVMTWRHARPGAPRQQASLTLVAAGLGLVWNAGALMVFGLPNFGVPDPGPWVAAISYSALGFLPAVVVDAATRSPEDGARPSLLALSAYILSTAATVFQAVVLIRSDNISRVSLWMLIAGYFAILVVLGLTTPRRAASQRALPVVALAAFAVTAFHLTRHSAAADPWWVELEHHSSLPLALVILYQDYRFAFADLFLKRALSVLALVVVALAGYQLLIAPMMGPSAIVSARLPAVLLLAWLATALCYPTLNRLVERFVDRIILGRTDYRPLRARVARGLSHANTEAEALDLVCAQLGVVVAARTMTWEPTSAINPSAHEGTLVDVDTKGGASITVPTADAPGYRLRVADLVPGRRLLSDDVSLLDASALLAGRRVDELRMERERVQRNLRESEMQRLTAESELRALRAQLNPHFLFNALTTIGSLIQTSPQRALETLYQLTSLLRAVLRRSTGDYVTLAEELHIVESYLAIEAARLEERLRVSRRVPARLARTPIPPLVLQPIVENAIKHGIAALRAGGEVFISADTRTAMIADVERTLLCLSVTDTGAGVAADELVRRRHGGVGLRNIERRLEHYYGTGASLRITSAPGRGTTVEIVMPIPDAATIVMDDRPYDAVRIDLPEAYLSHAAAPINTSA